ncbi:MAG: alpha/beta hydrolase [Actinobacteria bacterium]|nr:alpha/beta hydrolase [Actinomycetota bacterium]
MALRSFVDGALFAEVLGEGSPRILALHGWGRRGADFRPSLYELPALALDLPGFGVSPPPSGPMGAAGYADIVSQILPEFDGPVVLIGHSFGGRVAICLAGQNPGLVGAVILTGTPLVRLRPPRRPSLGYRMIRRLNRLGLVGEARLEMMRQRHGSPDYRAATGVMRDVLVTVINESYEDELRAATMPLTLLWGAEDDEVPQHVAESALTLRGDLPTTLRLVPGVGHHLPLEAPEELRRVVTEVM